MTWGNNIWNAIHCIALVNKGTDSKKIIPFLKEMIELLPCEKCKEHSNSYIQNTSTNTEIFEYTIQFHNYINNILGKPLMNLHDAKKIYEKKIYEKEIYER